MARDSTTDSRAAPSARRDRLAWVLYGVSFLTYCAYGWTAIIRFGLLDRRDHLAAGLLALAALWLAAHARPVAVTIALLAIVPLFGNHPGGRLMELLNVPLAASAAGLVARARREGHPPPSGRIAAASVLYVLTIAIAVVPTIPQMLIRAGQINDLPLLVAEALTAPEGDPLYSFSSVVLATMAVVWALALAWTRPDERFVRTSLRALTAALFAVMLLGILDQHGVISLASSYLLVIDPRTVDLVGLQSIFWNPGWFAWYFVMAFALALGLLTVERGLRRWATGAGLLICYVYSWGNPQRGGLIATHLVLGLFAWYVIRHRPAGWRRHDVRVMAVAAGSVILLAVSSYALVASGQFPADRLRSVSRTVTTAQEVMAAPHRILQLPSERLKLWHAAIAMWRDAPILGLGEGSFAWRFHDYRANDASLHRPFYGDAHSTWLQILATRGLVGLAAYLFLLFAIGASLKDQWGDPARWPVTLGASLALAGFLVYSFVQAMFYLQAIQLLFWFVVALLAGGEAPRVGRPHRRRWLTAAAACAMVALAAQFVRAQPLFVAADTVLARQPRGFYGLESSGLPGVLMRWSSRSGELCLDPGASRVRLQFAVVDPRVATLPRVVALHHADREIDRFEISSVDIVTRTIELAGGRPSATPSLPFGECSAASQRLRVSVNRIWSPLDSGFSLDARHLGVAVFEPTYLAR